MRGSTATAQRNGRAWPLLLVLLGYGSAVALFLSKRPLPVVDDWIYIDAASTFAERGVLEISPLSLPVAVFEAVFGGTALFVFGPSITVLSAASAVLAASAAVALFDLLRRGSLVRTTAALVAGVFLFTPVFFGLSLTFMTDSHAVSLAIIAAALMSRGIDASPVRPVWLILGSIAASTAYLSRPGAVFVICGAVIVALARRQWSALLWMVPVPAATVAIHLAYQAIYGVSAGRVAVMESLSLPTPGEALNAALMLAVSVGFFLMPLGPLIVGAFYRRRADSRLRVWFLGSAITLSVALLVNGIPYLGDWFSIYGIFPLEGSTAGRRQPLLAQPWAVLVVLVALVLSAASIALVVRSRPVAIVRSGEFGLWTFAAGAALLSTVSLVATAGTMLDRYLVVFLPAVLLTVGSRTLRGQSVRVRIAGVVMLGLLAVVGASLAIDGIRVQNAVFATADAARGGGIPVSDIDGGAAWTGTQLGDLVESEDVALPSGVYWWRRTFAPSIEPRYVVSLAPLEGACVEEIVVVSRLIGADQPVLLLDTEC